MTARRLTAEQRQTIVREHAKGVLAQALAERFSVSRQSVHAILRRAQDAAAVMGTQTRVVGVRVTDKDMRSFDAALARLGLGRSEAVKRMMRAVSGLLALDDESTQGLNQLSAAVNRMGGNVNQIARACNEARLRGEPLPYTAQTHAELREAAALMFDVSTQVRALARGRRTQIDAVLSDTFQGEVGPHED